MKEKGTKKKPRGRPFQKGNRIGFQKGNPGGPGRPRRAVEREYLTALVESVSMTAWRAIVTRAVKDAKAGDHRAREWIGRYLVGSDPILVELSEEIDRLKAEFKERDGKR